MKSTTFVLGALLASIAIAQPHKPHHARHHKRDVAQTTETKVVTDWVYEYETVDVTTTIWVSPGFIAPAETTSSTKPSTTSTTPNSSTSTSQTPAQFFQGPKTSSSTSTSTSTSSTPKPTPSTSSAASSSAPSPVYVAPTTSTVPSVYVAPVESSSSTSSSIAPVVVPTTTAPAAVAHTAPAETTTSAAPAPVAATSNSGSSSSGGVCSSGSPCTGDITYYDAGLGACGTTNNGDSERVVALPHGLMGTQSNGNPYCGKTITIQHGGKTTTATVVDKCMGCEGNSIDLSNAAFLALADMAVGRTTATWYFN